MAEKKTKAKAKPKKTESVEATEQTKQNVSVLQNKIVIVLLAVVIVLLGFSFFRGTDKPLSTEEQQKIAQEEIDEVLNGLEKHILLPDEQPSLATIANADQLKQDNEFYKRAKNGDKLLVFKKAQRAIVYRPTADIIVNVGPILPDGTTPDEESSEDSSKDQGAKQSSEETN